MADALVTADAPLWAPPDSTAVRHLLMVERADGHGWAVPGGHAEPGEAARRAALRELAEETGLVLSPCSATWEMPPRYVPDPRASDEAWAVTVPVSIALGTVRRLPAVTGADDARRAAWVPAYNFACLEAWLSLRPRRPRVRGPRRHAPPVPRPRELTPRPARRPHGETLRAERAIKACADWYGEWSPYRGRKRQVAAARRRPLRPLRLRGRHRPAAPHDQPAAQRAQHGPLDTPAPPTTRMTKAKGTAAMDLEITRQEWEITVTRDPGDRWADIPSPSGPGALRPGKVTLLFTTRPGADEVITGSPAIVSGRQVSSAASSARPGTSASPAPSPASGRHGWRPSSTPHGRSPHRTPSQPGAPPGTSSSPTSPRCPAAPPSATRATSWPACGPATGPPAASPRSSARARRGMSAPSAWTSTPGWRSCCTRTRRLSGSPAPRPPSSRPA